MGAAEVVATVAVILAMLAVVALLVTLKKGSAGVDQARIERLEATLKEALSGSGDRVVAQMGEGFAGKHRELSDSLRELLLAQERELRTLTESKLKQIDTAVASLKTDSAKSLSELREGLSKRMGDALAEGQKRTTDSLQTTMKLATDTLDKRFAELRTATNTQLEQISGKVTQRLDDGFKKTNDTFTQVVQRLTIIDQAQRKITELSQDVVSLQDILSDKSARGVFGEVQLNQLVADALPQDAYALQHEIAAGKRADCVLFLPPPTGTVAVDAKFPLENYRRMFNQELPEADRAAATKQFKKDVKTHIDAISSKYIVAGVTADGAVMFLPAEAVFAEIHAHHPDLVQYGQQKRVWITSPTTMMAILTTARAVLKDAKTRSQVHIIQEHLGKLAVDFGRFQKRMDDLSTHFKKVGDDVDKIHISAGKISSRFQKIEQVQVEQIAEPDLLASDVLDSAPDLFAGQDDPDDSDHPDHPAREMSQGAP